MRRHERRDVLSTAGDPTRRMRRDGALPRSFLPRVRHVRRGRALVSPARRRPSRAADAEPKPLPASVHERDPGGDLAVVWTGARVEATICTRGDRPRTGRRLVRASARGGSGVDAGIGHESLGPEGRTRGDGWSRASLLGDHREYDQTHDGDLEGGLAPTDASETAASVAGLGRLPGAIQLRDVSLSAVFVEEKWK